MFKLALIGLDTSHSIAFTKLIQGDKKMVDRLVVKNCLRFPSAFQAEPDQDTRQKTLEGMGVMVTRSLDEAVEGVDGLLLEINDPALHWEYFEKVASLELPVFIDKPMADNLANAQKIYHLARQKKLRVWSSSSLRFIPEIITCSEKVHKPSGCNVFGPLGKAAKGSSVVWYGVHAFEMLSTLMGRGAQTLSAWQDSSGVVAVVDYGRGRRGIVECNTGSYGSYKYSYGGRAQNQDAFESFIAAGNPYPGLIKSLEAFFLDNVIPVALEETLEIQAMIEATETSLSSGRPEKVAGL